MDLGVGHSTCPQDRDEAREIDISDFKRERLRVNPQDVICVRAEVFGQEPFQE